jgi:hypothetical protein
MQRKHADLFMDGGGALDVGGIVYQIKSAAQRLA